MSTGFFVKLCLRYGTSNGGQNFIRIQFSDVNYLYSPKYSYPSTFWKSVENTS